jgi:hypothetical protein
MLVVAAIAAMARTNIHVFALLVAGRSMASSTVA